MNVKDVLQPRRVQRDRSVKEMFLLVANFPNAGSGCRELNLHVTLSSHYGNPVLHFIL
jgi:hypothetical protein